MYLTNIVGRLNLSILIYFVFVQVCETVDETTTVPGNQLDCKDVEKKVCRDVEKKVCKEVPQKSCQDVWVEEMTWVTSEHCIGKRSLGKKCKKGGCKLGNKFAVSKKSFHKVPVVQSSESSCTTHPQIPRSDPLKTTTKRGTRGKDRSKKNYKLKADKIIALRCELI